VCRGGGGKSSHVAGSTPAGSIMKGEVGEWTTF